MKAHDLAISVDRPFRGTSSKSWTIPCCTTKAAASSPLVLMCRVSVLAQLTMASCSSPPKGRLPLVIVPQTLTPLISRLRLVGEDPYHPFTFNALSLSPSSEPIFRLYSQLAYHQAFDIRIQVHPLLRRSSSPYPVDSTRR